MASAYFISDIHFGLESATREQAKLERVCSFLDHVMATASHLYIIGDLFDAWIEYRMVIPKGHHRILTKLEDAVRKNVQVHYLAGNHDFWMRDFFKEQLGIETHASEFAITLDGKKCYIHHGDGLATNDAGYRILKRILRNPLNIWLYSWIHPDIGLRLAQSSSKTSRVYTSHKSYGEEDGMITFATQKIAEGYDIVLMGHRHQPVMKQINNGLYVNLGDWITHNTFASITDGTVQLLTWS